MNLVLVWHTLFVIPLQYPIAIVTKGKFINKFIKNWIHAIKSILMVLVNYEVICKLKYFSTL